MPITRDGFSIDYKQTGDGPTIVLVPGGLSTTSAWRPISERLGDRYRLVSTSLLGYGRTDERRTEADHSIEHQLNAIDAVLEEAGEPLHLVGHSWGASLALMTGLRSDMDIRSLTLIDANPGMVLRNTEDAALGEEMRVLGEAYVAAFSAGEADAARRVIDFVAGPGSFAALSREVRNYVIATTPTNILDWRSYFATDYPLSAFAAIRQPSLCIAGGRSHPVLQRIAYHLANTIPNAKLAMVDGASHFLIATHPDEVAQLIESRVSSAS